MTVTERIQRTKKKVEMLEYQRKLKQKQEHEAQKKRVQRRNYAVGQLVTKYFPEISTFTSESDENDKEKLESLEAFLSVLSCDEELLQQLKNKAAETIKNSFEAP